MQKVSAIILNYKVKKETLRCIASLKKSTYKNTEIIVVDNNSQDGLEDEIKKLKDVVFIQTGDNLGYTGGNNRGISYALQHEADFAFIVNPDTTFDPDCISECMKVMKDKTVGIVGPKIYFSDKKTLWFAGGIFDTANVLGTHRGVDEKDMGQYEEIQEVDFVTGGAMFVRKEVFEKVGLFDEQYFLYYEDSDFCFRVKKAGFKILYVPKAVVYHKNAQSTGLGSPIQDYFITRNRMLFASKFLPIRTQFALIREAVKNIGMQTRRKALIDFLTGNFGKGSYKL